MRKNLLRHFLEAGFKVVKLLANARSMINPYYNPSFRNDTLNWTQYKLDYNAIISSNDTIMNCQSISSASANYRRPDEFWQSPIDYSDPIREFTDKAFWESYWTSIGISLSIPGHTVRRGSSLSVTSERQTLAIRIAYRADGGSIMSEPLNRRRRELMTG